MKIQISKLISQYEENKTPEGYFEPYYKIQLVLEETNFLNQVTDVAVFKGSIPASEFTRLEKSVPKTLDHKGFVSSSKEYELTNDEAGEKYRIEKSENDNSKNRFQKTLKELKGDKQ